MVRHREGGGESKQEPAIKLVTVDGVTRFEFAGLPKKRVQKKYEAPKQLSDEEIHKRMLKAMPLSEQAREAIQLRHERGVAPRAKAGNGVLRPHPMSNKLVGGQGAVDEREIEAAKARQAKEVCWRR